MGLGVEGGGEGHGRGHSTGRGVGALNPLLEGLTLPQHLKEGILPPFSQPADAVFSIGKVQIKVKH